MTSTPKTGKRRMRTAVLAAAFAAALLLGATSAWAYFTDYSSASGALPLALGGNSQVDEGKDGLNKDISVQNTGETYMFVRVQAYYTGQESVSISGSGWFNGGDGWWYWGNSASDLTPLAPGDSTDTLRADVSVPEGTTGDFDIVVVEEGIPAAYEDDGTTPYTPEWN